MFFSTLLDKAASEVHMDPNSLPLVKLIGTGGTISSWGATRLTYVDYSATGQRIDASELVARVPEVSEFARVECEQFAQLGSTSMGQIEWLKLGKRINQVLAEEPEVAGVVVAHGTSTMEETAYFLNLTVKSDRPVVLTGSMRPPSAMGTDADTNLMDAVRMIVKDVENEHQEGGKGLFLLRGWRTGTRATVSRLVFVNDVGCRQGTPCRVLGCIVWWCCNSWRALDGLGSNK